MGVGLEGKIPLEFDDLGETFGHWLYYMGFPKWMVCKGKSY